MDNMRFYDREKELEALERIASHHGASLVVLTGRRRVGKSRLVGQFLQGRDAVSVLVVPNEERQVAQDFAEALHEVPAPSFQHLREALDHFFTKSRSRFLFVDEFPNLLEVHASLPYEFQRAWERHRESSNKIVLLSGSYVRMMDRIFTRQKAPLFGRAQAALVVEPLPLSVVWEIQRDLGIADPDARIRHACLLGGIPYYYELLERLPRQDIVRELFFDVAAPLREEGQNVLRQEFGAAYHKYFAILEAISGGLVAPSELAGRLGVAQTTLSKYLIALRHDFKLVDRHVPFGERPARSKKGLYAIHDNLLAFWFAHVYGRVEPPRAELVEEFVSRRFEQFCREFLLDHLRASGVVSSGRWWGRVRLPSGKVEPREVDLVVETEEALYVGECKWSRAPMGPRDLGRLQETSEALPHRKPLRFVLFSKSGFNFRGAAEVVLFDPQRISRELGRRFPPGAPA
ncbi:MAG: ATP-binding protein [Euryarchaeota archaeon]|nr:ATP-binding protein [Euryarchaeota archaeon]MDE1837930.1 ATP-binding protein [Euryarchaeota archaeon]MDE1880174.1 ATP-binding protein [Euryarchaeota archaeon]MDE2045391.1 ATP-binding protein [Thermoplasmata archaeon]